MKKLPMITATCLFLFMAVFTSCNSQSSQSGKDQTAQLDQNEGTGVTIYYFHGDRRCATCKAVGNVSKQTIAEAFGENSNVVFKDINIDEAENNEFKDKFELSGSGLFVFDGKDKEDLTVFAFQKAVNSPEELTEKIVLTVKEML
jgi:DnaJ-class molecular chaperone